MKNQTFRPCQCRYIRRARHAINRREFTKILTRPHIRQNDFLAARGPDLNADIPGGEKVDITRRILEIDENLPLLDLLPDTAALEELQVQISRALEERDRSKRLHRVNSLEWQAILSSVTELGAIGNAQLGFWREANRPIGRVIEKSVAESAIHSGLGLDRRAAIS